MPYMCEGSSNPLGQELRVYAQLRQAAERSLLNHLLPVNALQCDEETMIRHLAERMPKGVSERVNDFETTAERI